ncbi:hypothetical protein V1477_003807 [Vespula maculifrons]|uniref:Uncharacterized protein n=1 Tax=Vespula maculifrons TaxID=7453 RepID=A0ABD2CS13_VESMC
MKARALLADGTETSVTKERKRGSRRIDDRSGSVFQNEFSQNGIHPEDSSRIDFTVKTEDRSTISMENEEKKEENEKEEEEEEGEGEEEEEEEEGGERRREAGCLLMHDPVLPRRDRDPPRVLESLRKSCNYYIRVNCALPIDRRWLLATTVQIGGNGRKLEAGQRSRRVSTTWHFRELRAERETENDTRGEKRRERACGRSLVPSWRSFHEDRNYQGRRISAVFNRGVVHVRLGNESPVYGTVV